jgi:alkanesulfonate monooxygenase SsuD/methylene tetrahydromethanopterin reductase-like flavin-dependent oxidoreductase (luciferase family)
MTAHDLRFGVVAGPPASGAGWGATARRIEDLGYDLLLVPDTAFTPSPFPALAAAAAVTTRLRMGTWVLASPLRTPGAVVRESSALQQLSDGRFELGVGTGRPDAEADARRLGVAWGSGAARLAQLVAVVAAVRESLDPAPPITVAAAGPRGLEAASRIADTVALAVAPTATVAEVGAAGERARQHGNPALALQLAGVGGRWVRWLARSAPPSEDAAAFLRGDAAAMAEQLVVLSAATGVTTFPVAEEHAASFAPVLALLRSAAAATAARNGGAATERATS